MTGLVEEKGAGVRRWREYLDALEEERKKIHVFQRELPLCLQLVTQTIESYRQQIGCEGDVATSSDVPVLEEFVPINRCSSVEEEESSHENESKSMKRLSCGGGLEQQHGGEGGGKSSENKTPHWMQSVHLSIRTPNSSDEETELMKPISLDSGKERGAFHPFHRDRKIAPHVADISLTVPTVSSTADTDTRGRRGFEGKDQGNSHRKARRCWSPELHRRFLHALKQLGGSHVATPKQIRELMKVDGLSNDEVKSHLQKYRLHTKRPNSTTGSCQTPQFILMDGIWVPPSEYASAADTDAPPVTVSDATPVSRIYAPVASVPLGSSQSNAKKTDVNSQSGEGGCRTDSSSPSTSRSSLIG